MHAGDGHHPDRLRLPMKAPFVLTEKVIVNRLLRDRYPKTFCLPNYTPPHWWECDMFELTAAGYFREYEVKVTLSDFRRDVEKQNELRGSGEWTGEAGQKKWVAKYEKKHDLLEGGDLRGPSQFFYVTPEGMLSSEPLPPWAGWIEIYVIEHRGRRHLHERLRVKAPTIHRVKMAKNPDYHRGTTYWRFHRGRT